MRYATEIPVRFGETDPAGIVYFPRLFHYYHCAFESFFGEAGDASYATWTLERKIGFPTVKAEATFDQPVRYGDQVEVELWIPRIGERSVDFAFSLGKGRSEARETKVCVDMSDLSSRPIPEELRDLFARYSGGDA